jgi:hypothetical protein
LRNKLGLAYHGRRRRLPRYDAAAASAVAAIARPAPSTAASAPGTVGARVVRILRAGGCAVSGLSSTERDSSSHVAAAPTKRLQDAEPFVAHLHAFAFSKQVACVIEVVFEWVPGMELNQALVCH